MPYAIRRIEEKTGEVRFMTGRKTGWPDDHVAHGEMSSGNVDQAYRWPKYPDAMAAAGVFAAQTGTASFYYEIVELDSIAL